MSASDAQRAGPAVPSSSLRICRHAARRYSRCRTGSVARSSAATHSRTVSWTTRPSRPSSTNGSARSRSKAPSERRQHAAEQGQRHAAQHAGGVERLARLGVEPVQPQGGELLHDGREHGVLGRVRPLAHRRGRELQRQRMAADEAVDPLGLRLVEPGAEQHLGGVGGRQRPERDRAQELAERGSPDGAGRVARADTTRAFAGSDGKKVWRSQPSSRRRCSAVSMAMTTRPSPRSAGMAARKPAGVGSTARPSTATTGTPRAAASARNARSSDDFPEPAMPWTTATTGPSSSKQPAQGSELRVAPDDRRAALGQQRSERAHRQAVTARGRAPRRSSRPPA